MKKIKNWIKNLSLLQQMAIIVLGCALIFVFLFFGYISKEIDSFGRQRVFSTLKIAQQEVIYNFETKENFDSILDGSIQENTVHIIYKNDQLWGAYGSLEVSDNMLTDIKNHLDDQSNYITYISNVDGVKYYNSVEHREGYTIVSIASDSFATDLNSTFISGVVYFTIIVLLILLIILFTWVTSMIYSINSLKGYVDDIKIGKEGKLNFNRGDEIGMLAESVISMSNELDKQEKIKMEMLHNISHDFKTPIATIKSYAESIKDGIYPYDTLEKSVDVIYDNADRLDKKVYSLLLINRFGYMLDEGSDVEPVKMKDVIEKVVLDNMALSKDVLLSISLEDIYYEGNEESWRVVVENIFDNALRYAKSKVEITLDIDGVLIIKNDGKPIDEENLDKIFRPYEKGSGGQFGLGLSIVKRVCNVYDYEVEAYNEDGWVAFRISDKKMKDEVIEKKQWAK